MIEGHVDANNKPVRHGFICACGQIGARELKTLVEHHRMAHPTLTRTLPPLGDDVESSDYRPLRTPNQRLVVAHSRMTEDEVAELRAIGRRAGVM